MQKIRLDLDEVQVDSFATQTTRSAERGTVRALSGLGCDTTDCYSATDPLECPCEPKFTSEGDC